MKEETKYKDIINLPEPDYLLIPLFEKFGSKPEAIVSVGDYVKRYQPIAKSKQGFSAPMHSPVSGVVEKIDVFPQLDGGEARCILIKNDGLNAETNDLPLIADDNSADEILQTIENAGIVGLGGAQFPTALKYKRSGKKVDTFIVNAAECEPYLSGDYSLMRKYCEEILEAIIIINKILEAEKIVLAFEKANSDIAEIFKPYLNEDRYSKIRLYILSNEYPQGGELQLAKTITGIEMPKGSVPINYGIIVSNVGTVHAVYNAVVKSRPLVERVITVSGEHTSSPGNYIVKIGTPIKHILENCGVNIENSLLVAGGPMMSPQILNISAPVHKGTLGVIALERKSVDRKPCIWCGYCADVCPMRLMPMQFYKLNYNKQYKQLANYDIDDCIECSACEYICPSKVPLIENIKTGKINLSKIKNGTK
jgi:electron transport complex protein RnfC